MTSMPASIPDQAPIRACTVSRDIQNFDLLIEDMEAELGGGWGDIAFDEARGFFDQPEAQDIEFIAVAVDDADEADIAAIGEIVRAAKQRGLNVLVIAEELSPIALHQLMRMGADDFVPYPLPEGALHEAIVRLRQAPAAAFAPPAPADPAAPKLSRSNRDGVVLSVQGLAGGVGASTFAVNLAWELALAARKSGGRVCLLDLDLQFGSAATYLDLPRKDAVFELLSDIGAMDGDSFLQALQSYRSDLHVLTAPSDILPLDIIGPPEVNALIDMARSQFEFVVIDMPKTLVNWTETVITQSHLYFSLLELDMRSAQNALRVIRVLKSEGLPRERVRYALNRAPKFTDLSGRGRVRRLADSLDIDIEIQLPDGGKAITEAGDHGLTLAETAAKSPLRREIQKLAASLYDLGTAAATAAQ
ncbi:pilus assembly protein CpaE [Rhodovulum sp. BSW8]|uniref:AAA family ATPase n=1 Tax=Rhodovulum visakhapatnamense TaxID=364297 RepID=A0A4R8FRW1_9RHOB|nr:MULTISPECIES: AAA family ATPase [Rhodovulum]OLS45340.1 pilus assembly protein CpaE [Rhodovulum sulfidophilum]MBL3568125.1 AAA family ATPase [Rhodovulum visakhapatnamense]MBL3578656.1 AAA family ATPase [Rhodovulum visakhapatnamense]RBO54976.1 pilus assembly protein CpaE [Rhodovulum sp. BSW8]TDX29300.1 pilus assembly protein CpaE [Rhodovulum visakhapatnamense]